MPRMLVVDDDRDIRGLLEQLLTEAGWRVTVAQNGHEALSILQQGGHWVVVLDLMMPGMGGAEVVERLTRDPASARQCRVILISASWRRKQPPDPQVADLVVAQLPKPCDLDELLEVALTACQALGEELPQGCAAPWLTPSGADPPLG